MSWSPSPFIPRSGMRSGHAQTIMSHVLPRKYQLGRGIVRDVPVEKDVRVRCHVHLHDRHEALPTLIAVHGLEGSADAQYILGLAEKAFAAHMNVIRMNVRSCGDTESMGPSLYHSGLSADLGAVVQSMVREFGLHQVGLAGYSMGGNLVLKLAGEWGADAPRELFGVATVGPAMDLSATSTALHEGTNRVYEWWFLWSLSRRFQRKKRLFPDHFRLLSLRGVRTLRQYDDRVVAPSFGFRDAEDYYAQSASSRVLDRIQVPSLVIHAADDPFIRVLPDTRARLAANPHIHFVETRHGGHCGFLGPAIHDDGRWAERECVSFLLHAHAHRGNT